LALITHLVFLGACGLFLFHFGHWIQLRDMRPDLFFWVALFLLRRFHYPHLILLILATGIASDLFEGHPWGSDALFFCLMHVVMDRVGMCSTLKQLPFFLLWGILWSILHFFWIYFMNDALSLQQFSTYLIVNLVTVLPIYFIFRGIRLGWGTRNSLSDAPILNA
jgi:hypothetical protein